MHPLLGPVLDIHVALSGEPLVLNVDTAQAWYGCEQTASIIVWN